MSPKFESLCGVDLDLQSMAVSVIGGGEDLGEPAWATVVDVCPELAPYDVGATPAVIIELLGDIEPQDVFKPEVKLSSNGHRLAKRHAEPTSVRKQLSQADWYAGLPSGFRGPLSVSARLRRPGRG